jgi:DNA polymerase I
LEITPRIETDVTNKYKKYWVEDFSEIEYHFKKDIPEYCVIDSETTGLHIKKDKPFMWVFGWLLPKDKRKTEKCKGRVFAFSHSKELLQKVINLSKESKILCGHNYKYDAHMMINGGLTEKEVTSLKNVMDTMGICRLIFEAVSDRDGGDNLKLKSITEKYIDPDGKIFETEVKKELRKINDKKRKVLIDLLKPYKGWGIGKIRDVYKVKKRGEIDIYTLERKQRWIEVPKEIEEIYKKWRKEYPPANYSEVPKEVMMEYVHSDGIYTLEILEKGLPKVYERKQEKILEKENKLINVLLKMERVGLKTDQKYLQRCYQKIDDEIQKLYEELWGIVGQYFTVSQDQVIANYFEKITGERPKTTDKSFLKKHKDKRITQIIMRLRRLEKWQSTYISRIIEVAEYDGFFYTQYNQFATVSGRIGSDAQQFPKERILTEEGEKYEKEHGEGKAPLEMEIFSPRRAFVPFGNGYDTVAYFDLSQIELRVQANYTILLGKPDLNLCRAYMPLNCRHYKTNEIYKFKNKTDRDRWNEKQENGESAWLLEDGTSWTPTDVHSETTHNALVALNYECEDKYEFYKHKDKPVIDKETFKDYWRKKGKTFNFMKNYGGGKYKAMETLDVEEEIAEALVVGWSNAFPSVEYYQNKVIEKIRRDGFATNMYGRSYYLKDTDKAYKVANYLIQGSCADMLKDFMLKIDKFLIENNCKSKQLANIHDEIQLIIYKGEEWIYPHIKKIMEDVNWMLVPVIVDLEVTQTNWAEKEEVELAV